MEAHRHDAEILLIYSMFLGLITAPFICIHSASASEYALKQGSVRLSYDPITLENNESLGLLGIHALINNSEYSYIGVSGFGAVTGERGGFLAGGYIAGLHLPLNERFNADLSIFLGAGGGGAAPQGGGLMLREQMGINYNASSYQVRGTRGTQDDPSSTKKGQTCHETNTLTLSGLLALCLAVPAAFAAETPPVTPATGPAGKPVVRVQLSTSLAPETAKHLWDNNPGTQWRTPWGKGLDFPHDVVVDLGAPRGVARMGYLRGQNGPGAVKDYEVYAGSEAKPVDNPVARGAFKDDAAWQYVDLAAPVQARYVNNLRTCQLLGRAQVHLGQTAAFLDQQDSWDSPYDVLFADPPYAALDELEVMMHSWRPGLLSEHATMIFEQDSRTELPTTIDHASLLRRYVYGDTALYLYGLSNAQSSAS